MWLILIIIVILLSISYSSRREKFTGAISNQLYGKDVQDNYMIGNAMEHMYHQKWYYPYIFNSYPPDLPQKYFATDFPYYPYY